MACEILVLGPGLVLAPPALEVQSLNHWTAREVPFVCACVCEHSVVTDSFAFPWIIACQTPLSMEFSRQEYWSGLPFPAPGDISSPGIEPTSPSSPVLAGRFFTTYTCVNGQWHGFH